MVSRYEKNGFKVMGEGVLQINMNEKVKETDEGMATYANTEKKESLSLTAL